MAMPRRIPITTITITISMKVNPARRKALPLTVFRPIECGCRRLGEHVEDVLTSPDAGVRLVLIRAHPPLGRVGHRVDRDAAEELELLSRSPYLVHPLHQNLELLRVALASELDVGPSDLAHVDGAFVLVDRG